MNPDQHGAYTNHKGKELTLVNTPKTAQGVLRRAAQIIREKGWTQRISQDSMGRVCLSKAISLVQANAHTQLRAIATLEKRVGKNPVSWNDVPGRTKEEVLAALEARA